MDELNQLLSGLPGFASLSDPAKQRALDLSLIPDDNGVWPGKPGYEQTYDVYYAALNLVGFMQAIPQVTSAGSEGTNVSTTKPDWASFSRYLRSMSPIINQTGNSVLTPVDIPYGPHVVKVPMNDRSGYFGDVDSDIG